MAGEHLTSRSIPIPQRAFSGGLNSTSGPLTLQDNESPDCQNVDFDKFGAVLKRNGYSAVNSSAFNSGAAWTSLHWFQLSSGSKYLVGTCGNKLAYFDSGISGSPTDITGSLSITAGQDNLFKWCTFLDTALGTNGVDVPVQWTGSGNGSAMTVPTGLTKSKFIKIYQNYIFLANVTVSATIRSSRIYWSDIRALTFTDTNNADISKDDGQQITGLEVLADRIVIFKEQSIWIGIFTGDPDIPFNFIQTASEVGCDDGYSIQNALNGLIFHAHDGFYYFDGNTSTKLSYKIQTTLDSFNMNRFQYGQSIYQNQKNRYWMTFTTGGGSSHNRIITYDTFNNAFSLYTGLNANCMTTVHISGAEKVYFGDYSGFVYQADTGLDDYPSNTQTAINAYYYTKWYDEGDITNQKGTPEAIIWYDTNNATLNFNYSYDLSGGDDYGISFSTSGGGSKWDTGIWDTATWGGTGGSLYRADLDGRGRVIRFKVSNSTLTETFKINGIGKLAYVETNV